MSVRPEEKRSVTLLPRHVIMKQSLDMVLFTITDYDLVHANDPGKGNRMTITLKGKIMSEIILIPLFPPHDDHVCHRGERE